MYILRITLKTIKKKNKLKINLDKLQIKLHKFRKLEFNKFNKYKKYKIKGIYKIKKKNKIFTLLKSPHVNKKSREHFIYKNYIEKIDINFLNFIKLLDFLIIFKKKFIKNNIINIKIIKNNKKICL